MITRRVTAIVLGVAWTCSLALAGCMRGPEDVIVGTWTEIDGTEVLRFFESGDVVQEDSGGSMGAHYRFVDDGHLRVDFGGPAVYAPPRTYGVVIEQGGSDVLVLTDEAGSSVRYRRQAER